MNPRPEDDEQRPTVSPEAYPDLGGFGFATAPLDAATGNGARTGGPAPTATLTQARPAEAGGQDGPRAAEPALRVEWAHVVRVNLLPTEVLQARSFRRTRTLLAGVVAATLALGVAGVVWAGHERDAAEAELAAVTAQTATLHAQAARYAQAPVLRRALDAARSARGTAMGSDVLWYQFLGDLAAATPTDVTLQSVAVSLSATAGPSAAGASAATASSDPLQPTGIGSVTFTGKARSMPAVAGWLEAVGHIRGVTGSTLTTAARSDGSVAFSSTVVVSSDALSHRYDAKAG